MKFLILHGSFGSKDENWFPQLKTKLELLSQEVILPQFPVDDWDELTQRGIGTTPRSQTYQNWINHFETTVLPQVKDEELCVIAHSLGPLFALELIDKFNLKIDSGIFVAPFFKLPFRKDQWQIDCANKSFYEAELNLKRLQTLIPVSYVLYSNNDPFVPVRNSLEFANEFHSSLIEVKGAKHMGSSFNPNEFPLVLELCKSRIDLSLYQKYLAHLSEYHPLEVIRKDKEHAILMPASELTREGTFHFQNLQTGGFCTLPTKNISYWKTESNYFKEGRLAAQRVRIERVYILEDAGELSKPELRKMINDDLTGGVIVYYCLAKDIENQIKDTDFGIWDESYVCTVIRNEQNQYYFSVDSRAEVMTKAKQARQLLLAKSIAITQKL